MKNKNLIAEKMKEKILNGRTMSMLSMHAILAHIFILRLT